MWVVVRPFNSPLSSSLLIPSDDPINQNCSKFTNCYDCLYNSLACGWCGSNGRCLAGNVAGPLNQSHCYDSTDRNNTDVNWEFTTSHNISITGNDGRIEPTDVEVFLRPGIPFTFPVKLTIPLTPPIDFLNIQDVSFSMRTSVESVRQNLPAIIAALLNFTKDTDCSLAPYNGVCVVTGLASYIEKPVMPYANWPEAYVYRLEQPLSSNETKTITALNRILDSLRRNFEHPEDAMEALMFSMSDSRVGWRAGAFKIPMINTDATAHEDGDGADLGIFVPNNADNVADGDPPGSGEDYPTLEQVRRVAIANDATPMFAATTPAYPYYQSVVDRWGFGAAIEVSVGASDIVQKITEGAKDALKKAVLATLSDDYLRVLTITPNDGVELTSGRYTDVSPNTVLIFNVTLLAPESRPEEFGLEGHAELRYVGFGNAVRITTYTLIQCLGCNDTNTTIQVDLCGICGGGNLLCMGCDGVLNSGFTLDVCGVCGGNGQTCVDCTGQPNTSPDAPVFDVCGECGGDGLSCVGCDGLPNSGLVENDCGECGGAPNCRELGTAIAALITVAAVGIVIAALALLFLIGAGAAMARADAALFEEEAVLQDNPLYTEAKRKFDNPLYQAGQ